MKTLLPLLLFLACYSVNAQQQVQTSTTKSGQEKKGPALQSPARPKKPLPEQPVIFYSGFLVDVARAEKPLKLLSLRAPLDPKRDGENVIRLPASNRPAGFKLFSIDF